MSYYYTSRKSKMAQNENGSKKYFIIKLGS